jgi:2-dehydro-3-deoxyphosphogluconate aldolase/(4S)-4-hydroxy-2-oxoglutarate aldolase
MSDPADTQARLQSFLRRAPVVPILTVDTAAIAVSAARALVAGGLPVIEITLRTPAAMDAIRAVAEQVKGVIVGAGTILSRDSLQAAQAAGARFGVSPGWTPQLLQAANDCDFPFLPGTATPSEVMQLRDRGIRSVKFFPAAATGGVAWLKALAAPLPDVRFCATGGIDAASVRDYLALPNVIAVGGSWLTPRDAVQRADWKQVEALAREAAGLRTPR